MKCYMYVVYTRIIRRVQMLFMSPINAALSFNSATSLMELCIHSYLSLQIDYGILKLFGDVCFQRQRRE